MKSTSHFAIAHLVYASLKNRGVVLDRTAFVYGNIAPDYIPSVLCAPHFAKACHRGIRILTGRLAASPLPNSGSVDPSYSKKLGMLCHYICDYFCFVHNKDFSGNMREHAAFESALDTYLRKNCMKLFDISGNNEISVPDSTGDLVRHLNEKKREYTASGYTFENDLCFAFDFCVSAILCMVSVSRCADTCNTSDEEDFQEALKRFATGNCYVFRMFFFKNRNSNIFFLPELMPPILS